MVRLGLNTLIALSDYFDVSLDYLLGLQASAGVVTTCRGAFAFLLPTYRLWYNLGGGREVVLSVRPPLAAAERG